MEKNVEDQRWIDHNRSIYQRRIDRNRSIYQRRIDHNSHHDQNILSAKGSNRKTTKGVSGGNGYHEACRWNLWRGVGERLWSL